jgi:dTDP-glucose 4,6-dehydratase
MRHILVTGGAGFIGSHFIAYILKKYPNYKIINIDKLTYAGNINNIQEFKDNSNHVLVKGDICDKELLIELFTHYPIDGVVHFAAESHVDRSITHPDAFMHTNIMGTYQLLSCIKKYWQCNKLNHLNPSMYRFHHISTDEVYGALGESGQFTEQSQYLPNSPYSASKASSDLIVRSFAKTYGINAVVTHCSNNFGPHQHTEKLIPTIVRKALLEESIPIYGKGEQIREWLYVLDHCAAIDTVFHNAKDFEHYNIGADTELSNIVIAKQICKILDGLKPRKQGKYADLIKFVNDRPGHDFRYSVCTDKLENHFDCKPSYSFDDALKFTVSWYFEFMKETAVFKEELQ